MPASRPSAPSASAASVASRTTRWPGTVANSRRRRRRVRAAQASDNARPRREHAGTGSAPSSQREHAESSLDSHGEGDVTPSTRSEVHPARGTTRVVAHHRHASALAARARAQDRPETAQRRAAEERPRRGRRRRDLPRARQAADAGRRTLRLSAADRPEPAALVGRVPARPVDGRRWRGVGETAWSIPRRVVRAAVSGARSSDVRGEASRRRRSITFGMVRLTTLGRVAANRLVPVAPRTPSSRSRRLFRVRHRSRSLQRIVMRSGAGYDVSMRSPNDTPQLSRHAAGESRTRACKSQ